MFRVNSGSEVMLLIAFVISGLLLTFGVLYAIKIALKPMEDTWKSVVVGDSATAAGMSALIALCGYGYGLSFEQVMVMSAIPWWCLALTGLPMIGGQVEKHEIRKLDAHALAVEGEDDGHTA
jgi:hypothetical protein